jgi:assimilatory nitrate reductase catalytic subunit
MAHIAEPFVELHPADAARLGLEPARLARVESAHGAIVVRVLVTDQQRPGAAVVPMHWTDRLSSNARVDAVVAGYTDPVSGQPELKLTRVSVSPFDAAWYGFAVLRRRPETIAADYWALARANGGWRLELAGAAAPADWSDWARDLLGADADTDLLAVHDAAASHHRFAAFAGDRLSGAVFVGPEPVSVSRGFAAEGLTLEHPLPANRMRLLAGRPGADRPEPGAIVCICFEVGINQIAEAVAGRECPTVADVGTLLKAGTNCGSCRADIQRIIHEQAVQEAV